MTDFSQFSVQATGFAASSPLIDSWKWIRDGTCDDPPGDGWFAVWVSYGESEDDMNFEAWQLLNGEPVAFSVATLLAKAGPFPDETTAEAWADAHNPYWTV